MLPDHYGHSRSWWVWARHLGIGILSKLGKNIETRALELRRVRMEHGVQSCSLLTYWQLCSIRTLPRLQNKFSSVDPWASFKAACLIMWCITPGFPFWSAPSINKSLASSISVFCISFNIETRPQVVSIDSWYMGSSNGVFLCATGKGENFRAMTFFVWFC